MSKCLVLKIYGFKGQEHLNSKYYCKSSANMCFRGKILFCVNISHCIIFSRLLCLLPKYLC